MLTYFLTQKYTSNKMIKGLAVHKKKSIANRSWIRFRSMMKFVYSYLFNQLVGHAFLSEIIR